MVHGSYPLARDRFNGSLTTHIRNPLYLCSVKKQLFVLSLVMIYSISAVGVPLHYHYCKGDLEHITLLVQKECSDHNEEQKRLAHPWSVHRTLAKVNYHIHTDAIKSVIVPPKVSSQQLSMIYASEADVLNVAVFGQTAKAWHRFLPSDC